ncbi:MAG: serine protease [Terriglobales bacterium]
MLKVVEVYGSGICIDHTCSVVATAYHIQLFAGGARLRVDSEHTKKVLDVASNNDTNKSDVPVGKAKKVFSYNIANDVSFIYSTTGVPHKSGVPYSYKHYAGQKVIVAGYEHHKLVMREAHIIGSNVALVVGKSQLNENLVLDIYVSPGASGSGVFDESGNLLGMVTLSGPLHFKTGDLLASIALPIKTIGEALVKLDPILGSSIFNNIPDEQPATVQTAWVLDQQGHQPEGMSPVIPSLVATPGDVPNSVEKLRAKAEAASELMVNYIARQCLEKEPREALCYELSIYRGLQKFRKIDKNGKRGKVMASFPVQKDGVWTNSDWTDTLGEIADNVWEFEGSMNDQYLFTYTSTADDDRCYYEEYSQGIPLFGKGHPEWRGAVGCFEQIVTDKEFNVLAVFTEMRPPDTCLTKVLQTAIYYNWIRLEGLKSPVLLPVMERISGKVRGQENLLYANMTWTDYKKFRVESNIKF